MANHARKLPKCKKKIWTRHWQWKRKCGRNKTENKIWHGWKCKAAPKCGLVEVSFGICAVRTFWDCESRCVGDMHSPPTCHIWLRVLAANWHLRSFAQFHFVLAISSKSRDAMDTQRTGNFAENRRASLGLTPRQRHKFVNARRRQGGDYFVCHLLRRLKETADRFLRVLYHHTIVGYLFIYLFIWPQEKWSIFFGGSFTLGMTHYSEI